VGFSRAQHGKGMLLAVLCKIEQMLEAEDHFIVAGRSRYE
jgi:flavin reductase (DIM6/NTAB) family NADH-FMN oxidoreductase RutF